MEGALTSRGCIERTALFCIPTRPYRATGIARLKALLHASLSLATADLRQASRRPSPGSTLAHSWLRRALHVLSTAVSRASDNRHASESSLMCARKHARRLSRPGLIPLHSFNSSAVQGPTADVFCAVAFDADSIKTAQTIRTILIIELAPLCR